jgi:hypothetical protein
MEEKMKERPCKPSKTALVREVESLNKKTGEPVSLLPATIVSVITFTM